MEETKLIQATVQRDPNNFILDVLSSRKRDAARLKYKEVEKAAETCIKKLQVFR